MDARAIRGAENQVALQAIDVLEDKLQQIKATIQDMLVMLEFQEDVHFPDLMGLFASLSNDFSTVQDIIDKSCIPARVKDNGILLKSNLLVPNIISLSQDPKLLTETENRVACWNHDVVPIYLRTQLNPHVNEQKRSVEKETDLRQPEIVGKQIQAMNKNIDLVHGIESSRGISISDRGGNLNQYQSGTASKDDLRNLVLGVMRGNGIRPKPVETGKQKK